MKEEECKRYFIEETRKLDPVLNPLGFVFELSGSAVSSAGPFASGFYIGGFKRIGLIYRAFAGVGAVVYEYHQLSGTQLSVTHTNLMKYLGKSDTSKLMYHSNKFSSYAKDGGNVFDAYVLL